MDDRCDQCRQRLRGRGQRTATRTLCESCFTEFGGLVAGYASGGTVENAISVSGWAKRLGRKKD